MTFLNLTNDNHKETVNLKKKLHALNNLMEQPLKICFIWKSWSRFTFFTNSASRNSRSNPPTFCVLFGFGLISCWKLSKTSQYNSLAFLSSGDLQVNSLVAPGLDSYALWDEILYEFTFLKGNAVTYIYLHIGSF